MLPLLTLSSFLIRLILLLSPASISTANFPESDRTATSAVKRFRSGLGIADLDSALQNMDEHLVSVSTRLGPLKIMGIDLHQAAMNTVKALWPDTPLPATVSELVELLKTSEDRLIDWRESAGRVMADEVLTIVLSWYENINLDILRTLRIGSKWSTDPELIKQRQDAANRFLDFAPVHTFCPDPNPEVEEEEAEAIEEDEDEAVDEDIEAEPRPVGPNTLGADGSAPSSSGTANDPPSPSSAPAPPNPDDAA